MKQQTPLHLTDQAAAHVRSWMARQTPTPRALRFGVKPSGCSGHQYVVSPADEINEQDTCFASQGIDIVVDTHSMRYLQGTEVDFVREGVNSGFRFNNPNVEARCGCGESFSIKEEGQHQQEDEQPA